MSVRSRIVLALALAAAAAGGTAAIAEPPPAGSTASDGPVVVLRTGERLPCREAPTVAFGRVAYTSPDGIRHALAVELVDLEATRAASRDPAGGRATVPRTGPPARPARPAQTARPARPAQGGRPAEGAPAPDFVAESAGGTAVRLSDLRGKVVLLDFWATWCAPCVKDVPRLKALVESLADEEAFAVIGVSLDRDRGALDAFVRKHDLRWPQAFDGSGWDNAVANAYRVQAIPHVVLVDRQGRVARRGVRGPDLDAAVRALLAAPGEPGEPVAPASTGPTGPTGATPGAR